MPRGDAVWAPERRCQMMERKSALFSLATASILIVNMFESDVGRYNGANYGLLKTVFEVNLKLFQTRGCESRIAKAARPPPAAASAPWEGADVGLLSARNLPRQSAGPPRHCFCLPFATKAPRLWRPWRPSCAKTCSASLPSCTRSRASPFLERRPGGRTRGLWAASVIRGVCWAPLTSAACRPRRLDVLPPLA